MNEWDPGNLSALRESQNLLEELAATDGYALIPTRDEVTKFLERFLGIRPSRHSPASVPSVQAFIGQDDERPATFRDAEGLSGYCREIIVAG